jgi:very-short-patch-repair endonuclease
MDEVQELIEIASHAKGFDLKLNLNEIELFFLETYLDWCNKDPEAKEKLEPQVEIGPYRVDFLYLGKYVIEIDGKEYHSTQEQREHDYNRERFLLLHGYTVIRFTAKEVREYPRECITQMMEIVYTRKVV